MCMNLLFEQLSARSASDPLFPLCERFHFHSFMLEVHQKMHRERHRREGRRAFEDEKEGLLGLVADELLAHKGNRRGLILYLDEFQVTDVADAMVLRLLFHCLWRRKVVVLATSNRPPDDLYLNGLNRSVFLPFIADLKRECAVLSVREGVDHRLEGTLSKGLFLHPNDAQNNAQLKERFEEVTKGLQKESNFSLPVVMGRTVEVPLCAPSFAAFFSFSSLCERPLGAADYLSIAEAFPYVFLQDIPRLDFEEREKIRRFITLLDVLYEQGTILVCSAAAEPSSLFFAKEKREVKEDETFASARALSRLSEMQTKEYVESRMEMRARRAHKMK